MTSFENTKSSITGSALGKALSMTSNTSWNDVVTKIKGVTSYTSGTKSFTAAERNNKKCGFDKTNGAWLYIPSNGYYSTGYKLQIPWGTIPDLGSVSTGNVLKGQTFTSNSGIKQTGTMKNYSNVIQTATTDTNNQSASCYQVRDGYIAVVPAIGYWGSWNFDKCIRVPSSSTLKHTYLTLTSSNSRYNFKYYNSSGNPTEEAWFYIEYNWTFTHQIVSAFIYINGVAGGYEYYLLSADGRCCQLGDNHWVALNLTHPSWNTGGYFPFPVAKNNTKYTVSIWYV